MNRYAVLYLATLFVLIPLDFLFLGIVAKDFFTSQVGNMLGEIKLAPAILFYLLYVAGTVIFVSGGQGATWRSTLLYGALFGFFCYATFDLTSLATVGSAAEVHRVSRAENLVSLTALPIQGYSFVATVAPSSITTFVVPMP